MGVVYQRQWFEFNLSANHLHYVWMVCLLIAGLLGCSEPLQPAVAVTDDITPVKSQSQARGFGVNAAAQSAVKIVEPAQDKTIMVGRAIYFAGEGITPNNIALRYGWDFAGASPHQPSQVPGDVTFNESGVYRVKVLLHDEAGNRLAVSEVRVITVHSLADNQRPVAIIDAPNDNPTIVAGESIRFLGHGFDPESSGLSYRWDFEGVSGQFSQADAGFILFTEPGDYAVNFSVVDEWGLADSTPAVRHITVQAPLFETNAVTNLPPNGYIKEPATDITVAVGDSVVFDAIATDPENSPINYLWNFDGATLNSTLTTPGLVSFTQVKVYKVQLSVFDSTGLSDPSPDIRTINVMPVSTVANVVPSGTIISPFQDMTVNQRDKVFFAARGDDPDGNTPLSFLWNFQTGAPEITGQTPGNVSFDVAGTFTVTLTIIDSLGSVNETPIQRTVTVKPAAVGEVGNLPPEGQIRTPAQDITINVGDTLFFTGEGVDSDNNTPLNFAWDFSEAVPALPFSPDHRDPGNVVFDTAGVYTVTLTVQDNLGLSDETPAQIVVTVKDLNTANMPPHGSIALPTAAQTISVGEGVQFLGVGVDPDDPDGLQPLLYQWDFAGGAPNSDQKNPGNVVFDAVGIYRVKLIVKDNTGLDDPNPPRVVISVIDANNQPPVGTIVLPETDLNITVGEVVDVEATATDAEGHTPLEYLWSIIDIGTVPSGSVLDPLASSTGRLIFSAPGIFQLNLIVTDSTGLSDPIPKTRIIVVSGVPLQPPANTNQPPDGRIVSPASDVTIAVGEPLEFVGEGVDPDGAVPLSFVWHFSNKVANSTAQSPGFVTFAASGTFAVTLTVTDEQDLADPTPSVMMVTVTERVPPEGVIISPRSDVVINVGESVLFGSIGINLQDNQPLTYAWNFEAVSPPLPVSLMTQQNPGLIKFDTIGIYAVSLQVTDFIGVSDPTVDTRLITVIEPAPPPPANINTPPDGQIIEPIGRVIIPPGGRINFMGTGVDVAGGPLTYAWTFDNGKPMIANGNRLAAPGIVVFEDSNMSRPHIHLVTLTVTNQFGMSDPTPATVEVMMDPSASDNNANPEEGADIVGSTPATLTMDGVD